MYRINARTPFLSKPLPPPSKNILLLQPFKNFFFYAAFRWPIEGKTDNVGIAGFLIGYLRINTTDSQRDQRVVRFREAFK